MAQPADILLVDDDPDLLKLISLRLDRRLRRRLDDHNLRHGHGRHRQWVRLVLNGRSRCGCCRRRRR